MSSQPKVTPPELARRWRKKPESVIALIVGGKLRAINISEVLGRPRYLIDEDDIAAYEASRAVVARPKIQRRQSRKTPNVKQYF